MQDADVTDIASRTDEYDYWFDRAAHKGQDALIVADPVQGLGEINPQFDTVTPLETVTLNRFGKLVYTATIYLATNYHG